MTMNITPKVAAYVAHEEGMVLEAYLDGGNVWTAFLGVTNASGHQVYPRYLNKPQSLDQALIVSTWLMENRYLPDVEKAFRGRALTEAQLAAALGFHWNTGAILRTDWVPLFRAGKMREARAFLEGHYLNSGDLTERRERESALFFDGAWPGDLRCPVYPVLANHKPDMRHPSKADLMPSLTKILGKL